MAFSRTGKGRVVFPMGMLLALFVFGWGTQAKATVLAGTFKYPDGSLVSGILTVQLPRPGLLNTCATPFVVVPTAKISIVNGAITGSPDIVPTDCINIFTPYKVQLRNSANALLFSQWWYIGFPGGDFPSPAAGSSFLAPAGLNFSTVSGATANPIVFQIAETTAGFRFGSSAISFAGIGDVVVSVSWNVIFPSTTYGLACTYKDTTTPSGTVVYVSTVGSIGRFTISVTAHKNTSGATAGRIVCLGRSS